MEEIEDIVRVYHAGAKKYGPNTWQDLDNGLNGTVRRLPDI